MSTNPATEYFASDKNTKSVGNGPCHEGAYNFVENIMLWMYGVT
jgi:hypothetical protein